MSTEGDGRNITFRFITPVFNYNRMSDFQHKGFYKGAAYTISLKSYGDNPTQYCLSEEDLNQLFKYGGEGTLKSLWNMTHSQYRCYLPTNIILVVDVVLQENEEIETFFNAPEAVMINAHILSALQIHASKGIAYEQTYQFRSPSIQLFPFSGESSDLENSPESEFSGHSVSRPHQTQYNFSPLGAGPSILRKVQYDCCRTTIETLIEREWDENSTFDKMLKLAIDYQETALCLTNSEHGFLILMVAVEALFKKTETENASHPSNRIAKLLCTSRRGRKDIARDFKLLFKVRNSIAHGNPDFDVNEIKDQYPLLYQYLTAAIIELLHLPEGVIGESYYDDLTVYVNRRYDDLFIDASSS